MRLANGPGTAHYGERVNVADVASGEQQASGPKAGRSGRSGGEEFRVSAAGTKAVRKWFWQCCNGQLYGRATTSQTTSSGWT